MNKVINGKRYDTEKAERVGGWDNGLMPNDFDFYGETLHRKRTGEFFLLCEGGARSRVARRDGSLLVGGESIEPIGYDEAEAWVSEHLDADAYAELFGEPDDGDTVLSTPISAALKDKLAREAARRGCSQRQIVEELIEAM